VVLSGYEDDIAAGDGQLLAHVISWANENKIAVNLLKTGTGLPQT